MHTLAEMCLTRDREPSDYVGMALSGVEITDDMAETTAPFVEYCRSLPGDKRFVEFRFNLNSLNPPLAMWGTADFVVYDSATRTLEVVDLKTGAGVVVDAKGNPQLRYYGLGAVLELGAEHHIDEVTLTIVQPNGMHPDGTIRSETISFVDLLEFGAELMAAARRTTEPDAPLVPGGHCKFCPASGACPAQSKNAMELAQVEWSTTDIVVPSAELLSDDQLRKVLAMAPTIEIWLKDARAQAFKRLASGDGLTGFKLVEKRAKRGWVNAEDTAAWLLASNPHISAEEINQPARLKSPAQVEKLIGKKNLPKERTTKQSTGVVMVPASDPRPEVASLASGDWEVLAIGSGDDE